jgi:hypothetical protein
VSLFASWLVEDLSGLWSGGAGGGGPEPEPESPDVAVPGGYGKKRKKKRKRVAATDWVGQLRAANELLKQDRGEAEQGNNVLPFPANRADAFKIYAERTPLDLSLPTETPVPVEEAPQPEPILSPEQAQNLSEFGMEAMPPPEPPAPVQAPPPDYQAIAAEMQGRVQQLSAMLSRAAPEMQALRRKTMELQRENAALRHELKLREQNDDHEAMAVIMKALSEDN